jgi:hypothetical protein
MISLAKVFPDLGVVDTFIGDSAGNVGVSLVLRKWGMSDGEAIIAASRATTRTFSSQIPLVVPD